MPSGYFSLSLWLWSREAIEKIAGLDLDDRQVAVLVHAVLAELDRPVEGGNRERAQCLAHAIAIQRARFLDCLLQHDQRRRGRGRRS